MSNSRRLLHCAMLLISFGVYACGGQKEEKPAASVFPKNQPQELNYESVSRIIQDMKSYREAVQKLDQPKLKNVDESYQGVLFTIKRKPLFLNVYPDPAGGKVIFLVVPKEPTTGSNYLLTFDNKLPVIDSETIELQIRTKDPEKPLTCTLEVPDSAAYLTEYPTHQFTVQYQFAKKFLQSGTYDFDSLTVPGYRTRGYAYITFDLVQAEVQDQTANLTAVCGE